MKLPRCRLLITGATGYLGRQAIRHWQIRHPDVTLWAASDRLQPVDMAVGHFSQIDLRDLSATQELVRRSRPTHVLHLAGLLRGASLADLLAVNVVGTRHLFEALADARLEPRPRVVLAGSAAAYGAVRDNEMPVREDQRLCPLGDYALSKACQDQLAVSFGHTRPLEVIRARLFNVLGPGQPENLVPMAFLTQLKRCAAGLAGRLEVGNTSTRRDFVDARDVIEALDLLLEKGRAGEAYNVGSGQEVSIQDVLDLLVQISGVRVTMHSSSQRKRADEVPRVCADTSKIVREIGWNAKISLRDSLIAMWNSPFDTDHHAAKQPR